MYYPYVMENKLYYGLYDDITNWSSRCLKYELFEFKLNSIKNKSNNICLIVPKS